MATSDPLFARFGREVRAGEVLFREGEQGDVMYVVQTGAIRVTKTVGGEERTLARLGPGEFVGEMAILNNRPRTATAVVAEDGRCLVITAKTLESMIQKNAEIALRLVQKLARRLDSADQLIEILLHRDPRARVILGLCRHAEEGGETSAEGVRLGVTADELAREVGVANASARDVFARLHRLGLVSERSDGGLAVADPMRLRDFLEFLAMPVQPEGER